VQLSVSLTLLAGLAMRGSHAGGMPVFGISDCHAMIYMDDKRWPTGTESARIEKKGDCTPLGQTQVASLRPPTDMMATAIIILFATRACFQGYRTHASQRCSTCSQG